MIGCVGVGGESAEIKTTIIKFIDIVMMAYGVDVNQQRRVRQVVLHQIDKVSASQ